MTPIHSRLGMLCLAAGFGLLATATVLGQAADGSSCTEGEDGKDGLCSRAMAAEASWESSKLGNPIPLGSQADTDITHCFLDIEISTTAKTVAGSNTLDVTSLADGLTQFTLDLRSNMVVDSVKVNGVVATHTRPTDQIVINLDRTYNRGDAFQVQVVYHGTPSNLGWQSFRFSTHGSSKPIVCSLSQPWWAHTWWPCKENQENVEDKFTLDMWVTVPNALTVASNGRLQGTDTLSGSRSRFRWKENHPIATYLVSLAATNYSKAAYTYNYVGGSMPVEVYFYPETRSTDEPNVADLVTMIATLSQPELYGQYPFVDEKYGIAKFSWCCGMEHQTITSQGSINWRSNIHELAHQWWGDMLTCRTWHDIWLNEGFATFSEALWLERKPGGSRQDYIGQMLVRKPVNVSDTVYCYDISDYSRVFSQDYSYKKAAWVVHMLRRVLGDEMFFDVLHAYRAACEGATADTEQFKAIAESVSGQDLTWFFSQWVYGGGAPSYRCAWRPMEFGGQYYVSCYINQYQQEAFSNYPLFRCPIDLTVTTASGSVTHTVWNSRKQEWYRLPADGPVTLVAFDKDNGILRSDIVTTTYVEPPFQCHVPATDPDGDGDADLDDFALYQRCLTGSGVNPTHGDDPFCQCFDLDRDEDVDGIDLAIFKNCMTGQGVAVDAACGSPGT